MKIEKMFFKICKEISRDRIVSEDVIKRIISRDEKLPTGVSGSIYINVGFRYIKIYKNKEENKIEITLNMKGLKNSDVPTQLLRFEIL